MKPLRRSLLFWLGLPGLVFLLWLWVDSFPRVSYAEYDGSDGWIVLMSDKGMFCYTLRDLRGGGEFSVEISQPRPPAGRFSLTPADDDLLPSDLFPRPFDINTGWNPGSREVLKVQVAHWFVGTIYLLAWAAILFFRRRWWKAAVPHAGGDGTPRPVA